MLALLSSMPGQELHTNEIIRRTGVNPKTAQTMLTDFERDGLLASRRVGNLRLWRMNQENPLYLPLRDLLGRTVGIPARLKALLSGDPAIKAAFLFGSYVTARDNAASDIDLFVLGEPDEEQLYGALRPMGAQIGRAINPIVWSARDLRRPTEGQRAFLDSILDAPTLWLVGSRGDLEPAGDRVAGGVRSGGPTGRKRLPTRNVARRARAKALPASRGRVRPA